jgi:hypothetical protein
VTLSHAQIEHDLANSFVLSLARLTALERLRDVPSYASKGGYWAEGGLASSMQRQALTVRQKSLPGRAFVVLIAAQLARIASVQRQ